MKIVTSRAQAFAFLTLVMLGISCHGQAPKELPKEKVSEPLTLATFYHWQKVWLS